MGEWAGVAIALASSSFGGTAAAITRYLVGGADPILLAILRWGIGFLCLLPCALLLGVRWPQRPGGSGDSAWHLLLRSVLHPLQHRGLLHDRRACQPCAGDVAAPHHGGRRAARRGAPDGAQDHGRRRRRARRGGGAGRGPRAESARCLARRVDHDVRGVLHGVLQRAVASADAALERARFPHRWHGRGRHRARARRFVERQLCGARALHAGAVDCRRLSRDWRRCARLHSLGHGAGAGDADPGRQYDDGQSDRSRSVGGAADRRADHDKSSGRLVAVFAGIWIATSEGKAA